MTLILGLDPGETTGWCVYDSETRSAHSAGEFERYESGVMLDVDQPYDVIVQERPVVFPARPRKGGQFSHGSPSQVGDTCYYAGVLSERARRWSSITGYDPKRIYAELTRLDVKKALSIAVHKEVVAVDDATVRVILEMLHGGKTCWRKGGALAGVKSHMRAALAVAVAYSYLHQ